MSLIPGLGHREGMALTLPQVLEPKGRSATRRSRPTSRPSTAAACSCCTTSAATSSARRASSAPRPAPSRSSTWAASTPRAASTSTGARPSSTPSGARSRRCADRPAGAGPGFQPLEADRPRAARRILDETTTTRSVCSDPRGDPGGVRLPAGRGAPAHRHSTGAWYASIYGRRRTTPTCVFEPPSPAAGTAAPRPPARRRRRPTSPAAARWPGRSARRGRTGRARLMPTFLKTPQALAAGRPRRARATAPTDTARDADLAPADARQRRVRRASSGPSATWARRGPSRRSRASGLRGRGGAGFRPATSGAPRRPQAGGRAYVVANGYEADPAVQTDRDAHGE